MYAAEFVINGTLVCPSRRCKLLLIDPSVRAKKFICNWGGLLMLLAIKSGGLIKVSLTGGPLLTISFDGCLVPVRSRVVRRRKY